MITYVLQSNGLLNIGRTSNILKRLKQYRTHNHSIQLLRVFDGNYETFLHHTFKKNRWQNTEWFKLDVSKIDVLCLPELKIEDVLTNGEYFEMQYMIDSNGWSTSYPQSFNLLKTKTSSKTELCAFQASLKIAPYTNRLPLDNKSTDLSLSEVFGVSRQLVRDTANTLFEIGVIKEKEGLWYFNPYISVCGAGTCQSTMALFADTDFATLHNND